MPPAFVATKTTHQDPPAPSGSLPVSWQMLGAAGAEAAATGKGSWIPVQGMHWKTFMARAVAADHTTSIGAASIEIHGANELATDKDAHTKFKVLGTLNAGAPTLEHEAPWRYVRAEVKTAQAGVILQVDMHGIQI